MATILTYHFELLKAFVCLKKKGSHIGWLTMDDRADISEIEDNKVSITSLNRIFSKKIREIKFNPRTLEKLGRYFDKNFKWEAFTNQYDPPIECIEFTIPYHQLSKEKQKIVSDGINDIFRKIRKNKKTERDSKQILKRHPNDTIKYGNWNPVRNKQFPKGADYRIILESSGKHDKRLIKRITCKVLSTARIFRFGFKLSKENGPVFGEHDIQSKDNNLVIHIGKDTSSKRLFLATYHKGERISYHVGELKHEKDRPINTHISHKGYLIDLDISGEPTLVFLKVNGEEVYRFPIKKEIRKQAVMYAWANYEEIDLKVENIVAQFENE